MIFFTRNTKSLLVAAAVMLAGQNSLIAEEPPLPAGLGSDEPQLPIGLGDEGGTSTVTDEPSLPAGLGDIGSPADPQSQKAKTNWFNVLNDAGFSGFAETRIGARLQADRNEDDLSIAEGRLRLQWQKHVKFLTLKVSGDLVYDDLVSDHDKINPVTGSGFIDLRESWLSFRPLKFMDVKLGRQSLTWGTGDLLFLNDMFAKDWQSFFIGRDLEYLKAPTDAARISLYSDFANAEVVYMPRFNPSRGITGQRLSYYNPQLNSLAGQNAIVKTDRPSKWFKSDQWAARLYRKLGSYELAGYGFVGYWSTPEGMDAATLRARYPRLNSYGLSLRGALAGGIANIEAAYYDSRQDTDGDDPLTRNSEVRLLCGYEFDLPQLTSDLTVAVQYYLENICNYGSYRDSLPAATPAADKYRHVATARITKLAMNQNLNLSMFGYFSPTDQDMYLRPQLSYKFNDYVTWSLGGNIFAGRDDHTFFGQFDRNNNVYTSIRFSH